MKNENKNLKVRKSSKFGLRQLACDERGMSTVEYVILLVVIVVMGVSFWKQIGGHVESGLIQSEDELRTLVED